MTKLILPSHIANERNYVEARREYNAQIHETAKRAREFYGRVKRLEYALQRIDPRLVLLFWDSDRPDMPPFRKGYWYVVRDNPGAPPTVVEIHENGQPCEPDSRLFDTIARSDLWSNGAIRETLRRQREDMARAEADRVRADEERQEHLRDLVNAATRTQVSMNREVPWTQNWSANSKREVRAKRKVERDARKQNRNGS